MIRAAGGKLHIGGVPDDSQAVLRAAVTAIAQGAKAKDDPARLLRWLRLRARAEIHGDVVISDICRDLGIPRTSFYPKTTALALCLVALLDAE